MRDENLISFFIFLSITLSRVYIFIFTYFLAIEYWAYDIYYLTENSNDVILQLPPSIEDIEDSENSQLQSSPEMYSLSIKETQDVMSIVGREIQLTKDYTTGNATFKQGSRGTVIEVPSRKDGKLKVKLDNDNEKTFRLIKECDLQLYEGGPLSFSSESQTEETSFEY